MVVGRYAPSPTGHLHYGNLRTALLCWLQVRLQGGSFILRIDDLDRQRTRPGALDSILHDLKWLGLDWDQGPDIGGPFAPYLQSERHTHYTDAFDSLHQSDLLFACICSRKDIAQALSAPHASDAVNLYPGTCRLNPVLNIKGVEVDGSAYNWRFKADDAVIHFEDRVLGIQQQNLARETGDFVIRRKDGQFAYQLATVVDDGQMEVTDVVRSADLMDSTARQIALFRALGFSVPRFWHVPIMHDQDGNRMSKRDGADSAEQWRSLGRGGAHLTGYLAASVGLIDMEKPLSCRELLDHLSIDSFTGALQPRLI